ncbi:MAG: MBL fold metallo-hydrolase [Candidatus Aenigmarchaeota archaeon]|nr:MBL fold metallo-hydrolase [Candidatus Aenigmarchaeota archaeon]
MAVIEGIEIQHIGHSGFRIMHESKAICIDPFKAPKGGPADIILITHEHFDHCDEDSVERLRKESTTIIGPAGVKAKLQGVTVISAGGQKVIGDIAIEAVPAYNRNKPYHPKGLGVGYVITIDGRRIYHAGDTDRIPEMKSLGSIDIALLPVSGTYTMTAEEAAAAANEDIRPKAAVPMHYGVITGSKSDAEKFKRLCNCEVTII